MATDKDDPGMASGGDDPGMAPGGAEPSMAQPDVNLIQPGQIAFHLDLTAAQLKIVHTAVKSLYDDLGHEEGDVKQVVASVLDKLPGEHDMRAIDLSRELRRESK